MKKQLPSKWCIKGDVAKNMKSLLWANVEPKMDYNLDNQYYHMDKNRCTGLYGSCNTNYQLFTEEEFKILIEVQESNYFEVFN